MEEGDKCLAADRILGRACLSEEETKMATLLANALFVNGNYSWARAQAPPTGVSAQMDLSKSVFVM
jgi:hypothetical protein